MNALLTRNISSVPQEALKDIREALTASLDESFTRINAFEADFREKAEIGVADALDVSRRENRNVTNRDMAIKVAARLQEARKQILEDVTKSAEEKLTVAFDQVRQQSPRPYTIESVNREQTFLAKAFEDALNKIDEYSKIESGSEREAFARHISSALATALKNPNSTAFYVAPDRTAETHPDELSFKDLDNADVAATKRYVCMAAFFAAMKESLATSGTTVTFPAVTGITLGLVTRYAVNATEPALIAGGVSGALQFIHPLLRDGSLASSDLWRRLKGIDRNAELRKPSSLHHQARVALADRYGSLWLRDFEAWALRPASLSLSNAIAVANRVRGNFNHHLLLKSEFNEASALITGPRAAFETVDLADAKETRDRYEVEAQKIDETLQEFGMSYGVVDHAGIRCLSHMRDKALSEDAKKLNEYLRRNLRFTTKQQVLAEAESWIRTKLKYTCSRYTLKHEFDPQSITDFDRSRATDSQGYTLASTEP